MTTTAPPSTDPPALLSDRGRALKIALLVVVLALGGWHLAWRLDVAHFDVAEMMAEPTAHQGDRVMLAAFRVVSIEGDRAELWSPWSEVDASPVPADLEEGQLISMTGTFHGTRSVTAEQWKVHRRMKFKKAIGLAAMVLVVALAVVDLRAWRRGRA